MMTEEQLQNLESAGLKAIDPTLNVRDSQEIQCLLCGNIFKSFPKAKIYNFKQHGLRGCATCTAKERQVETHKKNLSILAEKFTFPEPIDLHSLTNKTNITVTNKTCGHTFSTKLGYLINDGVNCSHKDCLDELSRQNVQAYNAYTETLEVHPNKLTTNEFLELFESIKIKHGSVCSLHNFTEYKGYDEYVDVKCDNCGNIEQYKPRYFLWRYDENPFYGCSICLAKEKGDRYRLTIPELMAQIHASHGAKYSYPHIETEYTSKQSFLTTICPKHGEFQQNAGCHTLGKQGCPSCARQSYSQKAIKWLTHLEKELNIYIQHAENDGEFRITGTRYFADGYCKTNNTIYEFHGSAFHGDLTCYDPDSYPSPYDKTQTAQELYDKTLMREQEIRNLGFNLVTIWESEFDKMGLA